VAKDNPLKAIALGDLERSFVAGSRQGDINLWSQLGVTGAAAQRRIHIYGLRDDGGFATAFRDRFFGKLTYAPRYEPLDSYEAVIRAVAADPYGMGIVGWVDAAKIADDVRILPITVTGQAPATPARETVAAGHYPLTSAISLYLDKVPDKPLDPLARAWVEAALSDEGQAIIAAQSQGPEGYLPLSPEDLATERARLAKL
jgi:phosphate transport system substrate-binding protein